MKVREALKHKANAILSFIGPDEPVTDAVRFMCASHIGSLLVQNERGETQGIVTERDIMRLIDKDADALKDAKVKDIMTRDLICALMDDDLDYVMRVMDHNKVRHLPVVSNKRIVGMISIGDVVHNLMREAKVENRKLYDFLELSGQL